ncbi:MAG TPA: protocatechuate 3,4-dioxygenase subunit alpha [Acidobacteriaceae bacterium]|jgi:protocatechuate 3,4-dioxygenase alpha subunit
MSLRATTWQTVGPFFRIGLERLYTWDIAGENVHGERVAVQGRVIDGAGSPVSDAILEIWQANAAGKYDHPDDPQDKPLEPGFRGFGRIPTDDEGRFRFTTIKPGPVLGPGGIDQSSHLVVNVLMRGLLRGLVTRAYFPDQPQLATDPILQLVDSARRETLILKPAPESVDLFHWDIRLQGNDETVFFEF